MPVVVVVLAQKKDARRTGTGPVWRASLLLLTNDQQGCFKAAVLAEWARQVSCQPLSWLGIRLFLKDICFYCRLAARPGLAL